MTLGQPPVGARLRRREDPRLLSGRGRYVADLRLPGMLHAAFLRSPLAHGTIDRIDTRPALGVPGVVAAFSAADLAGEVRPLRAVVGIGGHRETDQPILADGRLRLTGEPVAIVIGETRRAAEDGVDAIDFAYSRLPAIPSIETALAPDAPALHDGVPGNAYWESEFVLGDVDAGFRDADLEVELQCRSQRCSPLPLEGRGVVADFSLAQTEARLWVTAQWTHQIRDLVAESLGIPAQDIAVIVPDVGGAFGMKMTAYPEYIAVAFASRRLGRPVQWLADRREELLTGSQAREQVHDVKAAVASDGRLLAVRARLIGDSGAYSSWPASGAQEISDSAHSLPGPYVLPAFQGSVTAVATNKAPVGPYRGVGAPMACFTIERLMDEIALRLDLDPLEVRLRNLPTAYPYANVTGSEIPDTGLHEMIERIRRILDYDALRAEHRDLREGGIHRGVGFALSAEWAAAGMPAMGRRSTRLLQGYDTAMVRVQPDGRLLVSVGTHSQGQGHETTFAQIVAHELGVRIDDVSIACGDSRMLAHSGGTWGSRSVTIMGAAIAAAAGDVRTKIERVAASMLEASEHDIVLEDSKVMIRGVPGSQISLEDVSRRAYQQPHLLPDGMEPLLEATRTGYGPDKLVFSGRLHAAVVEVDVETGGIDILRYVALEDSGQMINPMIVEGQIMGAIAQGIGHALLERVVYDDSGQPLTTSLLDYKVPEFGDVPSVEIHHIQTPARPTHLGVKGMAEGPVSLPPPTLAAAVSDALAPFGARIVETPITPDAVIGATQQPRNVRGT